PLPPGARSGGGRPRGQMWGPARRRRRAGTTTRRDGTHAPGLSLPPARMRLKNHRMNYFPLTTVQQAWQERTAELSAREIGPRAAENDRTAQFPQASLSGLRAAGVRAIRVPQQYGGLGLDLVTTCLIVEEVAKQCPSTAMCYKMHLEAMEAISEIPRAYHRQDK